MYICAHTHIYICVCLYVYVFTYKDVCIYIHTYAYQKTNKMRAKTYSGAAPLHAFETHFPLSQEGLCVFSNVRKPNDSITSQEQICWDKITSRKSTKSIISASSKWKKAHVVGNGLCLACKRLSNKTFVNHLHGTLLQHTPAGQTLLWHNLETLL